MGRSKVEAFRLVCSRTAFTGMSLLLLWLPLSGCGSSNSSNQTTAGLNTRIKTSGMKPIASGPVKYVALGDSTGVGVGANEGGYVARLFKRIEVERPGSTLINLCFSGATSEDVLSNQLGRGLAREPTLVTLGIGINDIGHGIALEQFAENYEKTLSQLRAKTGAAILVTNIPDISTAPRIPPSLRDEMGRRIVLFNERIAEVTSKHEVAVFDIYSSTHEVLASRPELFSGDGFHPSDAGYEHWANEMWPVIAEALR
jgi:acyl-CoA thioesterase-1